MKKQSLDFKQQANEYAGICCCVCTGCLLTALFLILSVTNAHAIELDKNIGNLALLVRPGIDDVGVSVQEFATCLETAVTQPL